MKIFKLLIIFFWGFIIGKDLSVDLVIEDNLVNGLNITANKSKIEKGYSNLFISYKNGNRKRKKLIHSFIDKNNNSFIYLDELKSGRKYNFYLAKEKLDSITIEVDSANKDSQVFQVQTFSNSDNILEWILPLPINKLELISQSHNEIKFNIIEENNPKPKYQINYINMSNKLDMSGLC